MKEHSHMYKYNPHSSTMSHMLIIPLLNTQDSYNFCWFWLPIADRFFLYVYNGFLYDLFVQAHCGIVFTVSPQFLSPIPLSISLFFSHTLVHMCYLRQLALYQYMTLLHVQYIYYSYKIKIYKPYFDLVM